MLHMHDIALSYGDRTIFNNISWVIPDKQRAALIGPNGAGKTTLLKIITGELQPDHGTIVKPNNYTIGCLPQEEIAVSDSSALAGAMQGKPDLVRMEQEIEKLRTSLAADSSNKMFLAKLGELEHTYDMAGGYRLESEAKAVLAGMGFKQEDFYRSTTEFSGGWRMRIYLARLLLQAPDLLLLDEPTNHLDLESLEWLEQYLLTFAGSIVIVSHDRYFINRLAGEICELENGELTKYVGNYHSYEQVKEQNRALLLKKAEQQSKERKKQQEFIDRFRYKNTKASQVQSRIKMLEKMQDVNAPAPQQGALDFHLQASSQSYKTVLQATDVCFKYDEKWIFQGINVSIYRGEKVALVGENGAGKTTLTRLIVGQLSAQSGRLQLGEKVNVGYYAQHQIDALDFTNTVYEEVEKTVAVAQVPNIRNILGLFGFHGDDAFKSISVLSGGEKARVSLAKILLSPVNFLIMDEPTNHLDIYSKQALERALSGYDGALILISHDRYFLDRIVNRVIEVKNGGLYQFEGNYSYYLQKSQILLRKEVAGVVQQALPKSQKDVKREQANARQAVSRRRNELTSIIRKCEHTIQQLESKKSDIEILFAHPETYKNGVEAANISKDYEAVKGEIDRAYSQWEKAQSELDDLLASLGQQAKS